MTQKAELRWTIIAIPKRELRSFFGCSLASDAFCPLDHVKSWPCCQGCRRSISCIAQTNVKLHKCHFYRFAWKHSQPVLIQEINKKADLGRSIEIIRAQSLKLCTLMIRSDVAVAFKANLHNSIPADRPTRRTSVHLRACHELSVLAKFN